MVWVYKACQAQSSAMSSPAEICSGEQSVAKEGAEPEGISNASYSILSWRKIWAGHLHCLTHTDIGPFSGVILKGM